MAQWGVQGSMQVSLFVIVLAFPRRRCPSRLHCCRLLSPGFVFCPAVLRFRLRTRVSLLSCALYSQYRSSAVPHQRRAALHRDLQVACGGAELPLLPSDMFTVPQLWSQASMACGHGCGHTATLHANY